MDPLLELSSYRHLQLPGLGVQARSPRSLAVRLRAGFTSNLG